MSSFRALKGESGAQKQVEERRLRPIYDWLDNGNNKKALAESERVLKKQPDLTCAKVLMSLALLRMGRNAEAVALLDKVLAEKPTKDDVLQAMTIAFKELQQADKICTMYENAVTIEPKNEELLSQLFMSYVRLGYYKKQQSAAMQLYKASPKNPYYFWAVMSLLLQAQACPDENMAQTVMLPLAERMVVKLETEGKMEQEQETHIYLMVLEMQHKFNEALAVLDGPLGRRLVEKSSYVDFVDMKRLEYMKKLEMWRDTNMLTKKLLEQSPDQWSVYLDYITSLFKLIDEQRSSDSHNNCHDAGDIAGSSVSEARTFFNQLKKPTVRGPYLAEIELKCRMLARREDDDGVRLVDLLVSYFETFGEKPVSTSDMQLFLPFLESTDYAEFRDRIKATIKVGPDDVPLTLKDIHRDTCMLSLGRLLGDHHTLNTEQSEGLAQDLLASYFASQDQVSHYAPTEQRPNDHYLVLASHILWQLWMETKVDSYFWKAVVPMEFAVKICPANYHLRFLLIKFYVHAGAVGCAETIHQHLELKHIQLDSLGHLISRHMFTCGHFKKTAVMCANSLKFFTSNYKETVDHIVSGYRFGSFAKIQEFIKLRERIASSQLYKSLTLERILMDLLVETTLHEQTVKQVSYLAIEPDRDEISWKDLTDNRDLKVMVSFDPTEKTLNDDQIAESFMMEQHFLRLRSLTTRAVVAAVQLTSTEDESSSHSENKQKLVTVIGELADSMEHWVKNSQNEFGQLPPSHFVNPIQGPDRPRLILYLRDGHPILLVHLLRMVIAVQREDRKDAEEQTLNAQRLLKGITSDLTEAMTKEDCTNLLRREQFFEEIVNALESCHFICTMCGVCKTLLSGKTQGHKKGKKKKESSPLMSAFITSLNSFLDCVEDRLSKVQDVISDLMKVTELDKICTQKLSDLSIGDLKQLKEQETKALDSLQEGVAKSLDSSYQYSFWELQSVIKKKLNYAKALKS